MSQDFVENAVLRLVTRFLPLNPDELNGWVANPEEWLNAEDTDNEQWEYQLRVRIEQAIQFLSLLIVSQALQ